MKDGTSTVARYWDFEVTLLVARRTWRRFLIQKSATFADLHLAIQDAFEWQNYHLYEFRSPSDPKRVIAGLRDEDAPLTPDAKRIQIKDRIDYRFYGSTWFEYEYDFGDGWIHEVKLRGEVSISESFKRRMLSGERTAPPEDCSGPGGHERLLSVVEQGVDPWNELDTIKEWLGNWTPERFDLELLRKNFDRATGGKQPARFIHN
jgi:hypothetical protein